jgi:hypothetical protein
MSAIGRNRASRRIVVRLLLLALGLATCGVVAYAAAGALRITLDGRPLNEKAVELNGQLFVPLSVVEKMAASVSVTSGDSGEVVEIVTAAAAESEEPEEPEAAPALFADDFDGTMKDEWRITPRRSWTTVQGDLVAAEVDREGRAYALVGDPDWRDYCVDVDMRVGRTDRDEAPREIGLLCRAGGEKDYIAFLLAPQGESRTYFRVVRDGKAGTPVSSAPASFEEGDSVHIRLVARGKQLTAYLNGDSEPIATYGSAEGAGAVGLMVDLWDRPAENGYAFDNFVVTKLPPGGPLPAYPEFKKWDGSEAVGDEEAPAGGLGNLGDLLQGILGGL